MHPAELFSEIETLRSRLQQIQDQSYHSLDDEIGAQMMESARSAYLQLGSIKDHLNIVAASLKRVENSLRFLEHAEHKIALHPHGVSDHTDDICSKAHRAFVTSSLYQLK